MTDTAAAALAELAKLEPMVTTAQVGYGAQRSRSFALFEVVAAGCDRDALLALLRHASVSVRGYVARRVLSAWPEACERLYPLLTDDAPLSTMSGCLLNETTLSAFVFGELFEHAQAPGAAAAVVAMVLRATADHGLGPFRAQGLRFMAERDQERAHTLALAFIAAHDVEQGPLWSAASVLQDLARPEDTPWLEILATSEDRRLRVLACEPLARIAASSDDARQLIDVLRKDEIPFVRQNAEEALERHSGASGLIPASRSDR